MRRIQYAQVAAVAKSVQAFLDEVKESRNGRSRHVKFRVCLVYVKMRSRNWMYTSLKAEPTQHTMLNATTNIANASARCSFAS